MSFYIHIQQTPNPNALKYISQYTVKTSGKSNYHESAEAEANPLAQKLFVIDGVRSVFFFDNYITVSKTDDVEWPDLSKHVHDLLQAELPFHDPEYEDAGTAMEQGQNAPIEKTPEIIAIDEILDRTVRPYLAADGGGIEIVERNGNFIYIRYQGACGSCPSSIGGTLQAIQSILRDELDPEIEVIEIGGMSSMYEAL
jgi:Fe-S cluster biogenesis protein NfuA